MYQKIMELARDMETDLITIRRDFHKYAEPGWCEMRTSSLIARELTALGYRVLTVFSAAAFTIMKETGGNA